MAIAALRHSIYYRGLIPINVFSCHHFVVKWLTVLFSPSLVPLASIESAV